MILKLYSVIIKKAKKYALDKKISLSRIVESYLQALTLENEKDELEISPFVKGISTGSSISNDLDYKKEYGAYLTEKYK